MAGSYELKAAVAKAAGIDLEKWAHEQHAGHGHGNSVAVSADGKYSIEFVECLASCGTAPVMMCNEDFYEGVSNEKADKILEGCK